MKNIISNKKLSDSEVEKYENLMAYLQKQAKCFGLPSDFELDVFLHDLANWLTDYKQLSLYRFIAPNLMAICYSPNNQSILSLNPWKKENFFVIYFSIKESVLLWEIFLYTGEPSSRELEISDTLVRPAHLSKALEPDIINYIESYITHIFIDTYWNPFVMPAGRYAEATNPFLRNYLYTHAENHVTLALLGISVIRKLPNELITDNQQTFYLWLTENFARIIAFDAYNRLSLEADLPTENLEICEEMGRDRIKTGDFEFLTQIDNDRLYRELITALQEQDPKKRIREVARLNQTQKNKNENDSYFAQRLLKSLS
ncbi:MAG: hypothetical protein JJT94_02455 [Bernardetiaceae bacterium]|nr:hypothetical protein [Bernardetiaceae bacterium]